MSRAAKALLAATVTLLALGSAGCQAAYTSIRKTGDNEYLLTRTKQGPFNYWGDLYACKASADGGTLTCTHAAEP